MGDSLCLQPWVSIGGNGVTILQNETGWVDLAGYQDIVIYCEIGLVTIQAVTTTLSIQTCVSKDQGLFAGSVSNVTQYTFAAAPTLGVQPLQVVGYFLGNPIDGVTPLARYLRWSVVFPATDSALTFRIWLNCNPAGW